jgi:hypothetical protein
VNKMNRGHSRTIVSNAERSYQMAPPPRKDSPNPVSGSTDIISWSSEAGRSRCNQRQLAGRHLPSAHKEG